jgi:hypothetical protein
MGRPLGGVRPSGRGGRGPAVAADRPHSQNLVRLRRPIVVLMSAQGQAVPDIAQLLDCSPEYVRTLIPWPAWQRGSAAPAWSVPGVYPARCR